MCFWPGLSVLSFGRVEPRASGDPSKVTCPITGAPPCCWAEPSLACSPVRVPSQVFKSDVGPDGNARDELDVACAIDHPNLTKSLGVVRASNAKTNGGRVGGGTDGVPEAAASGGTGGGSDGIENLRWLVMKRVVGQPLAQKPDFSSVLRCRWGSGRRFEPVLVLAVLLQVRSCCSCWFAVCGLCLLSAFAQSFATKTGTISF